MIQYKEQNKIEQIKLILKNIKKHNEDFTSGVITTNKGIIIIEISETFPNIKYNLGFRAFNSFETIRTNNINRQTVIENLLNYDFIKFEQ